MIKIEKLSSDAVVEFTRNDKVQVATVGALLTRDEATTLNIRSGSVTYSIDELELVTKSVDQIKSIPEAVPVAEPVETPAPAVTPAPAPAKKIVYPSKKK